MWETDAHRFGKCLLYFKWCGNTTNSLGGIIIMGKEFLSQGHPLDSSVVGHTKCFTFTVRTFFKNQIQNGALLVSRTYDPANIVGWCSFLNNVAQQIYRYIQKIVHFNILTKR